MNIAADIALVVAEFGATCAVQGPEEPAPRDVKMVVLALSTGNVNSRNNLLSFMDTSVMAKGSDWGYGLLLAEDAPEGMNRKTALKVNEQTGAAWTCEAAKELYEIQGGEKKLVAWRLALRGKQRMVRGR